MNRNYVIEYNRYPYMKIKSIVDFYRDDNILILRIEHSRGELHFDKMHMKRIFLKATNKLEICLLVEGIEQYHYFAHNKTKLILNVVLIKKGYKYDNNN